MVQQSDPLDLQIEAPAGRHAVLSLVAAPGGSGDSTEVQSKATLGVVYAGLRTSLLN